MRNNGCISFGVVPIRLHCTVKWVMYWSSEHYILFCGGIMSVRIISDIVGCSKRDEATAIWIRRRTVWVMLILWQVYISATAIGCGNATKTILNRAGAKAHERLTLAFRITIVVNGRIVGVRSIRNYNRILIEVCKWLDFQFSGLLVAKLLF